MPSKNISNHNTPATSNNTDQRKKESNDQDPSDSARNKSPGSRCALTNMDVHLNFC